MSPIIFPQIEVTAYLHQMYHRKIINKMTSVFHASVIDNEFLHNIVKVAVDPQANSQVDPKSALTMHRPYPYGCLYIILLFILKSLIQNNKSFRILISKTRLVRLF